MNKLEVTSLLNDIDDFIDRFLEVNKKHQEGRALINDLEATLEKYTQFILNDEYRQTWDALIDIEAPHIRERIDVIRRESAHCVWAMEKYRASTLLESNDEPADYFKNVESCIEEEFGNFVVNKHARVLLIGVGAFPMTPLTIAKNTGAKIVGIDIDDEATAYAKKVLNVLGKDMDIEVHTQDYRSLPFVREATHIIIASTIPEKLDILRDLYELTNEDVVVSMRYGNGFKSLFNYPLVDSQQGKWRKANSIYFDDNVFDVAMFRK